MVEMKALKQLSGKEDAQIVNYVGGVKTRGEGRGVRG